MSNLQKHLNQIDKNKGKAKSTLSILTKMLLANGIEEEI